MKLVDLDRDPLTGDKPLTNCVRHLRAALASTQVTWDDQQRFAAEQACEQAEALLQFTVHTCDYGTKHGQDMGVLVRLAKEGGPIDWPVPNANWP